MFLLITYNTPKHNPHFFFIILQTNNFIKQCGSYSKRDENVERKRTVVMNFYIYIFGTFPLEKRVAGLSIKHFVFNFI